MNAPCTDEAMRRAAALAQFLEQPQHPLRTRVVEVMHGYHVAL
jgi:hypothetical protein